MKIDQLIRMLNGSANDKRFAYGIIAENIDSITKKDMGRLLKSEAERYIKNYEMLGYEDQEFEELDLQDIIGDTEYMLPENK